MVTIKARIQNFSLLPTTAPVKVHFYLGDPAAGGTLIQGVNGENEVFTFNPIAARGNSVVEMQWQIPGDIGQFSRIYAVVDPNNVENEIHETNNTGWTVLEVKGGNPTSVAENKGSQIPASFQLQQNFPNPFNPMTTISYALPRDSHVKLTVFDVLGREVAVLVDAAQPAGNYRMGYDASKLPSGIYFYHLDAGQFKETRKMLLVK